MKLTELDYFLSKLIPILKKELGSERALEILLSINPPDKDSSEEIREIRERLSIFKSRVKKTVIRVSAIELFNKHRVFQSVPISSSYVPSDRQVAIH